MYHCMIVIVHLKDTSVIELLHIDAIIIKNTHTVVIEHFVNVIRKHIIIVSAYLLRPPAIV